MKPKSLRSNIIINSINNILKIIFPMISFPYVSRVLGIVNLGKYNFSISIVSYFITLAGLGISTYAVREGARLKYDKKRFEHFAKQIFTINFYSTLISYLILIVLIFTVDKLRDYRLILLIYSSVVVFPWIGAEWVNTVYEDFEYITKRNVIIQLLSLIFTLLFVKRETDFLTYVAITAFSSVILNCINFRHIKEYCSLSLVKNTEWNRHLKPVFVIFGISVTVMIYVSSDTTILGIICDDYTVGIYSVSAKIYSIIKTVLSSIIVVSIPRLAALLNNNDKEEFNRVSSNLYKSIITIIIPSMTGIVVLRKEIVQLVAGDEYKSAEYSLGILGVALIFCMFAWFWGQCIVIPMKMELVSFAASLVSAISNIFLNFLLIPVWKENAAAFTTMIAELLAFIICRIKCRNLIPLEGVRVTVIKSIIGSSLIIFVDYIIRYFSLPIMLHVFSVFIASVAIYFLTEFILNNRAVIYLIKDVSEKK